MCPRDNVRSLEISIVKSLDVVTERTDDTISHHNSCSQEVLNFKTLCVTIESGFSEFKF